MEACLRRDMKAMRTGMKMHFRLQFGLIGIGRKLKKINSFPVPRNWNNCVMNCNWSSNKSRMNYNFFFYYKNGKAAKLKIALFIIIA